ncbi:MAG: hypothetical protein U1C56_01135, partial [Candidatus Curtissbacteria bacterium]|nr:hypothetical protein [Candidatus Curtissbacteria bacterium]
KRTCCLSSAIDSEISESIAELKQQVRLKADSHSFSLPKIFKIVPNGCRISLEREKRTWI